MRFITALVAATAVLLLGSNVALASSPQPVSLTLLGGVMYPGVQAYSVRGGQPMAAYVMGNPVPLRWSSMHYSLDAVVTGLAASGTGSFYFASLSQTGNSQWSAAQWANRVTVSGVVRIDSMTPAVLFPLGCTPGVDCTSAIPAFFNGTAKITMTKGGTTSTATLRIGIESPYLNPFGGPILMATGGDEVVIIATYTQALIQWTGVMMGGSVQGSIGNSKVTGSFGMIVNSTEDLRGGWEKDAGSIAFMGMSNPSFNSAGAFFGVSFIPHSSATPCPGFPPGTCSMTGLQSYGAFSQTTAGGKTLTGFYVTTWAVPAVAFGSQITGRLK